MGAEAAIPKGKPVQESGKVNWKSAGFGGVLLHASECALLEHFDAAGRWSGLEDEGRSAGLAVRTDAGRIDR